MIAVFITWPYVKVEGEPGLLFGFRDDNGKAEAIVCTSTDGAVKIVDLEKVKIDIDKLRNLPRL